MEEVQKLKQKDSKKSEEYLQKFENIVELVDPVTGLNGYIVIHTTRAGPALGATRMYPYQSKNEALLDAMRLARGMTYKCAIAKLPHGGGKAVLIGDPKTQKTPALLKKYAQEVTKLSGTFFTGEDVGMFAEDVYFMQQHGPYFIGSKGKAGDSSPYAALGVYYCMQTAIKFLEGSEDLAGKTIAIKGLGKTGSSLVKLLLEAGANVLGADINSLTAAEAQAKFPQIKLVSPEDIYAVDADIFAPCALGDDVSLKTIDVLKPKIICGVANNQLESREVADLFHQKGFLYIPDYLANAGGLIDVADELEPGGYSKERVLERIKQIKDTCMFVLKASKEKDIAPVRIADSIAEENF